MIRRTCFAMALLMFPLIVHSDEFRRVSVSYQLDVSVIETDYPHVVWEGAGLLRYKWAQGEGKVLSGDIPSMTQYCPVAIPGYRAVLLSVHGSPGSTARVTFNQDEIVVSGLSLDLDVLEGIPALGVAVPPPNAARPMLHVVFPELRLVSKKIDSENMSVDFEFKTFIPRAGNEKLDQLLAGKTVAGRFRIALRNPYQK